MYNNIMLLKLRKPILKYTCTFIKNHFHQLCLFKTSQSANDSIEIPVTIWQIVYIYMTAISPNLIS